MNDLTKKATLVAWLGLSFATQGCVLEEDETDATEMGDVEQSLQTNKFVFLRTHNPAWDMCMDVEGFGTARGTRVNQYPCKSTSQTGSNFPHDQNQRFRFIDTGDGYTFLIQNPIGQSPNVHVHCVSLMPPDLVDENGGNPYTSSAQRGSYGLVMVPCDVNDPLQQWQFFEGEPGHYGEEPQELTPYYTDENTFGRIVSAHNRECIDVPYGVNHKMPLQVHPCHGGNNQYWRVFSPIWFN